MLLFLHLLFLFPNCSSPLSAFSASISLFVRSYLQPAVSVPSTTLPPIVSPFHPFNTLLHSLASRLHLISLIGTKQRDYFKFTAHFHSVVFVR
ncbi:hypothetical protein BC939DRAFT_453135 [Gamsiella multidivaricata]|uniref:uncharacterized protein n=1 Tax=Gamsiella multidivaricata TaxID=101098 RepID=UPI002220922B|nr:uncharacterized protein BC939DRAFT_453135 [Gamsiella multidivaricata]KAI7822626.1 hypothetical protein BC939DRAFT_453135 [Gamsiella multidivaricata]